MNDFAVVVSNNTKDIDQFDMPIFSDLCFNFLRSKLFAVDIFGVSLVFISSFSLDPFGGRWPYS